MIDETASYNPLLCDPATGICATPADTGVDQPEKGTHKPVKVTYFSDPVCSACWAIEPEQGKLKLEYGDVLHIEYRMGGLLPNLAALGARTPQQIASHLEEVGRHFQMPISGKVWIQDPPHSSFPPSIAFKAAQMQDAEKALVFLRTLREMLFVDNINISKWEHIVTAAAESELDTDQLLKDYQGKAGELLEKDMELARQMGIKGFPTLVFSNQLGLQHTLQGAKSYADFEQAITSVYPAASKQPYPTDWQQLFGQRGSMTTKEFAILGNLQMAEADDTLEALAKDGKLTKVSAKNGTLWRLGT